LQPVQTVGNPGEHRFRQDRGLSDWVKRGG
jgi:hypothetical protein